MTRLAMHYVFNSPQWNIFEGINSVGSYKLRVLINPLWSTGDQGGNFHYLVHFQSGNLIGGKKYINWGILFDLTPNLISKSKEKHCKMV